MFLGPIILTCLLYPTFDLLECVSYTYFQCLNLIVFSLRCLIAMTQGCKPSGPSTDTSRYLLHTMNVTTQHSTAYINAGERKEHGIIWPSMADWSLILPSCLPAQQLILSKDTKLPDKLDPFISGHLPWLLTNTSREWLD